MRLLRDICPSTVCHLPKHTHIHEHTNSHLHNGQLCGYHCSLSWKRRWTEKGEASKSCIPLHSFLCGGSSRAPAIPVSSMKSYLQIQNVLSNIVVRGEISSLYTNILKNGCGLHFFLFPTLLHELHLCHGLRQLVTWSFSGSADKEDCHLSRSGVGALHPKVCYFC